MDAADLLILSVVACLDGLLLVWLLHRGRRRERERRMAKLVVRGVRLLAKA
jgi:hypothetical protein